VDIVGPMTTTINYTLPSGKTAVITVAPTNRWDGTMAADIIATVQGIGTPILCGRTVPAGLPAWAVSAIGKLPLTAEIDAAVTAAVDAIDATHVEHNAAAKAHLAELDAVSISSARIARAMACGE
jgi:hypothetical protein